jgi:GTP-binding protein HflX
MEKSILVGVDIGQISHIDYYMEELRNLAISSNFEVVYSLTQSLNKINAKYYIGKGKVEEIKMYVDNLEADVVIMNNELTGSQLRNLEEILQCRVIDRTLLILDIFARRAKTKEAMLQVEIAQLDYMLPRLTGLRDSLNRQQGGIGSRGPGEKKLELDRRKLIKEKSKLEKELRETALNRQVQRKKRNKTSLKKVALVGYTNSGKSTLLNLLLSQSKHKESKFVFSEDLLFATLETSTRKIETLKSHSYIITDTVGFVSNLPHKLIEAFKSTLEEITEADLLIHVVDSSNPYHEKQIEVTNETLKEIGVTSIPIIYIYNKIDLLTEELIPTYYPFIKTSVRDEKEITKINNFIEKHLFGEIITVHFQIPFTHGAVISKLKENYNVKSIEYTNEGTLLMVDINASLLHEYAEYLCKK